tara:strand:+ start:2736 stop:3764 length:1029 start_codon:yes stop_codon:yes gene_type:complete
MQTCTWAPTTFSGGFVVGGTQPRPAAPSGKQLRDLIAGYVARVEALGFSHLLMAQRWWGSGEEMEGSSLDCLAMTSWIAQLSRKLELVTAIHPGFFSPTAIAKWGATLSAITDNRWSINVTSGWNLREFDMFGVDALEHDERYARSIEFIEVLRGAWSERIFDYEGSFYSASGLELEPRPVGPLTVFQGGQSDAAISMAGAHSDWMYLNGGDPDRVGQIIERARAAAAASGRTLRFAMYAQGLCRQSDDEAWDEINKRIARIDPELREKRIAATSGASGMWASHDDLSMLDTNEGFAARLIGSRSTILERLEIYRELGVDMLHTTISDEAFCTECLPEIRRL